MAKTKSAGANVDKLFAKPSNGSEKKPRASAKSPKRAALMKRAWAARRALPKVVSLGGKQYLVSGTHVAQL